MFTILLFQRQARFGMNVKSLPVLFLSLQLKQFHSFLSQRMKRSHTATVTGCVGFVRLTLILLGMVNELAAGKGIGHLRLSKRTEGIGLPKMLRLKHSNTHRG